MIEYFNNDEVTVDIEELFANYSICDIYMFITCCIMFCEIPFLVFCICIVYSLHE